LLVCSKFPNGKPPNALRPWRFAASQRRDAVLSSEHVKHVHGGFVENRDCRVVSDVIRLTRDRAESSKTVLAARRCSDVMRARARHASSFVEGAAKKNRGSKHCC
jgi:hypothetical protein